MQNICDNIAVSNDDRPSEIKRVEFRIHAFCAVGINAAGFCDDELNRSDVPGQLFGLHSVVVMDAGRKSSLIDVFRLVGVPQQPECNRRIWTHSRHQPSATGATDHCVNRLERWRLIRKVSIMVHVDPCVFD